MKRAIIVFFVFISVSLSAQQTLMDTLFRNSYHVWEMQRNNKGMYRDSKLFKGEDYHPCSIANVGIGLISLCISDSMGWEDDAMAKALLTLQSVNGHTYRFDPDRNESGFFRHFIDMSSGKQFWNSEYSTIDTEILVAGALFAKNYFKDESITKLADELWESIDHEKAIADAENGKIFLKMETNGEGVAGSVTSVYNEYMIVAWMAKNASNDSNSPANILWKKYYTNPENIPVSIYANNRVLTDRAGSFLSSFTQLFNYYLCHYFTTSETYNDYLKAAQKADYNWWQSETEAEEWEWGCGAGTGPEGYHADKIKGNPNHTISPHIIAGFIPVFPEAENHLKKIWENSKGIYNFPHYNGDNFLWRYSLKKQNWSATEVQGIDYSTMLFGLATLPQFLGPDFFKRNNNYFENKLPSYSKTSVIKGELVKIPVNPVTDTLIFEFEKNTSASIKIEIIDIKGQILKILKLDGGNIQSKKIVNISDLPEGVYIAKVTDAEKLLASKKFVKK